MKNFRYFLCFVAGVLSAGLTIGLSSPVHAGREEDVQKYRRYLACRDKNPKVVTYECLRLYPMYGLEHL